MSQGEGERLKRDRVLSVWMGPTEKTAWQRSCDASSSRWVAQWCRETMSYAIRQNRAASLRPRPDADPRVVAEIRHLSGELNRETKHAHQLGFVPGDVEPIINRLLSLADLAAPSAASSASIPASERQSELVNVRLSDEELERWSTLSRECQFPRPATWVRYTVARLLDITLPPIQVPEPDGLATIRRDLAGVVTNCSQLRDVAGEWHSALAEKFDTFGVRSVDLLSRYRVEPS